MGNILVYGEHAHGKLPKATGVAIAAANEISAKHGGGDVILAILSDSVSGLTDAASKLGASKVVTVENAALANHTADVTAAALKAAADATGSTKVVFASTSKGKDISPRLAGAMDAAIAPEITAVNDDGTFTRPTYAGNAFAVVEN
jgi:electron transfer flavoprotein alpha subunit